MGNWRCCNWIHFRFRVVNHSRIGFFQITRIPPNTEKASRLRVDTDSGNSRVRRSAPENPTFARCLPRKIRCWLQLSALTSLGRNRLKDKGTRPFWPLSRLVLDAALHRRRHVALYTNILIVAKGRHFGTHAGHGRGKPGSALQFSGVRFAFVLKPGPVRGPESGGPGKFPCSAPRAASGSGWKGWWKTREIAIRYRTFSVENLPNTKTQISLYEKQN